MDNRIGRRATTVLIAAALTLALAATALAAHPTAGRRYAGTETNVSKVVGFSAPVSFKVSSSGTQLMSFIYGTFGCTGAGGFRPGVNRTRRPA